MVNPIRPRRGTKVWRRSAALTVLVALSVSFPLVAVAAPSIHLSPAEGTPGTTFTVTGSGFGLLVPVEIRWDGTHMTTTSPTVTGNVEATVTVPQGAEPGPHRVVASQALFPNTSATFTVVAPATTTTSTTTTTTTTTTTSTTSTSTTSSTGPSTSTSTPTTTTTTGVTSTSGPPDTSTTSTVVDTTTPSPNRSTTTTNPLAATGSTSTTDEAGHRLDPLDTSDPFGPEVMAADIGSGKPDSAPPRLAGGTLGVKDLSVKPSAGMPGTSFQLSLTLEGAIPGLFTVSVLVDDEPLGDPIAVDGDHVDVQGVFPELPPGTYPLVVVNEATVLARAEVHILDEPAPARTPVLVVGLVLLTVTGVGWGAHWVTRRPGSQEH